jgi:3-phosphoglycerate kinase
VWNIVKAPRSAYLRISGALFLSENPCYYLSVKSVKEANLDQKRVLVRADLDVEMLDGHVSEEYRLKAVLPTIEYLMQSTAQQIVLVGHLGRPQGLDPELSLKPVCEDLSRIISQPITFVDNIDYSQNKTSDRLIMLENLKFWPGETKNDQEFAKQVSAWGDLYINESFATSQHEYASIVGLPKLLPHYAGLRLIEELAWLGNFWQQAKRPVVFLLGGAKTDKLENIKKMAARADVTLVAGVFDREPSMHEIKSTIFPIDVVDHLDLGIKSVMLYKQHLSDAKTILWNGPVGKFEEEKYMHGTQEIALHLAQLAETKGVEVVVGGGDSVSALHKFGVLDKMTFVSTGGGAMLDMLGDGVLPGVEALN